MTPNTEHAIERDIRELISFAIMDGQNQIHDLKDGTATPEEVNERMFKSLDYFTEKAQALIANQVAKARIAELERLSDTYYDDGRIGWGDSTKESVEEWGENHADLWIPTRYVHKHIEDRIATLNGVKNKEKDNEN